MRIPRATTLGVLLLVGGGCSEPSDPVVEAHRGGAGYWPQNSATAARGAVEAGFEGLEVDLALTVDEVPVLAHDPWLDGERCTWADGSPLTERVVIAEQTLDELRSDYRCGGLPDPDFLNAEVVAERVMSLDTLLDVLKDGDPRMVVHLDVKVEEADTLPADRFAAAILDRWYDADLPNPWYVSANLPETIRAFEDDARRRGLEVPTSLIWPRFPPGASTTSVALGAEIRTTLGLDAYLALVEEAGADGLTLYYELADRQQLSVVRDAGYAVGLWTLNDPAHLAHYGRWPVDYLITDYPGDLP